jgi:Rhodanese-like domain
MRLFYSLAAAVTLAVLVACNSTEQRGNNNAGGSAGNGNSTTTTASTPASTPGHVAPSDGIKRVTTVELREALEKGTALVVDVRGDAPYKQSHIKGSISIPVGEVEARLSELPRDKMIVTYCS